MLRNWTSLKDCYLVKSKYLLQVDDLFTIMYFGPEAY